MKTMNTNEKIPNIFYIFLDFGGFIGKSNSLNLEQKIVSSGIRNIQYDNFSIKDFVEGNINYLPFTRTNLTFNSPSTFMINTINNYNIEYNLELYRFNYYKQFPSRLSGIYAFGDYKSCELAAQKYKWNLKTVKRFKLNDSNIIKVTKHNMEIISLLRHIRLSAVSKENQEYFYNQYLLGNGNVQVEATNSAQSFPTILNSGVIYEYLIEGCLTEVK